MKYNFASRISVHHRNADDSFGQNRTGVSCAKLYAGDIHQHQRSAANIVVIKIINEPQRMDSWLLLSPPGNVLADSIDNSISEDSLASLIRMPGGCVEQNLASITLPLIAYLYLERTNNWESVGVERKAEALRYIRRGETEGKNTWIRGWMVEGFPKMWRQSRNWEIDGLFMRGYNVLLLYMCKYALVV